MPRIALFLPALLLGAVIGCEDQYGSLAPSLTVSPVSAGCPANPTVTVFDDTTLRAALKAAKPGDVIAVSGTIEVTVDDTIGTNNVTLTCATPGSGLVATAAVLDMVTVIARGDVATGLVLDGSQAGDSPLFALNDGVTAFAQDVQFTNNTVTCARFGECVFVAGGTGLVVSDNQFQATDPFSGVHLQANGPDATVFLPIRIDGAQVLRNTIVATTPSLGLRFGGIRVFDAGNILIADNVISGPWSNGFSPFRVANSQIQRNEISGPLVDGIRTSSAGGGALGLVTRSVFSSNRVTGAGSAGVFVQRACANQFVSNDLRGNADGLGLLLNDSTGANVVTGVNNAVVLDNGAFDCDGDGGVDSNIITGGVAHRGPPPPDTLSSSTRSRGSIVLQ